MVAATTTAVATTTTTSLATARPTMGGRRGRPEADSLATTTATTEEAVSGTAIVLQISSAVTCSLACYLATSAPGQTTMADQQLSDNFKNTKTNDNVAHFV